MSVSKNNARKVLQNAIIVAGTKLTASKQISTILTQILIVKLTRVYIYLNPINIYHRLKNSM